MALINDILQATIVIFGSAVVLYNLRFTGREPVVRAFNTLLTLVVLVYFSELIVTRLAISADSARIGWLRLKWVGITLVPAAQFQLSNALLVTTGSVSSRRRTSVILGYVISFIFLGLAIFSDLLVGDVVNETYAPHFEAAVLFPLFAVYYWLYSVLSITNVWRAIRRCITSSTRSRMRTTLFAIMAAPLAVFPYLAYNASEAEVSTPIWFLLLAGNLLVGFMFATLTANMVYFGPTSPDRVVRVRLYKFMARVPMTGFLALLAYTLMNRSMFGLSAETLRAVAVVATVMLVEWAIHAYKGPIERLLQLNDDSDVRRIQDLSERLVTEHDLRQYLESITASACDTLRRPTAFVASFAADGARVEAISGPPTAVAQLNADGTIAALPTSEIGAGKLIRWHDFWLQPLYDNNRDAMLGIFGVAVGGDDSELSLADTAIFGRLARQASSALEDRRMQQAVFAAVEGLLPELTELQARRGAAKFGGVGSGVRKSAESSDATLKDNPAFRGAVRDALNHFWGGPKLTESPLLDLEVVQAAATEHDGNVTRGLRTVLQRAIDYQKPEGDPSLTRPEWVLYNILELKFVQGKKVRDIARRLAMSESDLYRKQRVAIENVSRAIYQMERERQES